MVSWAGITEFGDSAAMLPAAAFIGLWLVAGGAWHRAVAWTIAVAVDIAVVIATKIAFIGWGLGIYALDFTGVSGHSALATAILSGGSYLAVEGMPHHLRTAVVVLGMAGGLLIGVSRLELHVHSVSEVVAGCLLGGSVAAWFMAAASVLRRPALPGSAGGGVLLILLVAVHGQKAPAESWITQVALSLAGHSVPYTRSTWAVTGATGLSVPMRASPTERGDLNLGAHP